MIGAMPRAKAASAVIWQRISYPPLALPGTDHELMSVSVSPNMLVKAEGKDPILQTPAGGRAGGRACKPAIRSRVGGDGRAIRLSVPAEANC